MDLFVSKNLLDKMGLGNSCMELPYGKAFELFTIFSKKYIVVGSGSTGREGTLWVDAYECILEDHFKGESFSYNEHSFLVNQGKKERGYTNIRFSYRGTKWVVVNDKITFKAGTSETQLTFF